MLFTLLNVVMNCKVNICHLSLGYQSNSSIDSEQIILHAIGLCESTLVV